MDLRDYIPRAGVPQNYVRYDGSPFGTYVFTQSNGMGAFDDLYRSFFDLGTPGVLVSWQKLYGQCLATYAQLWLGNDASVTEVGDWFASTGCGPDVAFGYRTAEGQNTGLSWSPPGGVGPVAHAVLDFHVYRQNAPGLAYADGGYQAYSRVHVRARHASFTPRFGRDGQGQWREGSGTPFTDVVEVVMHHGTRSPAMTDGTTAPQRCTPGVDFDPADPRAALYQSQPTYESYAMQLFLARGVGIVQEALLFTENDYWDTPTTDSTCHGAIMGSDPAAQLAWQWFLDP